MPQTTVTKLPQAQVKITFVVTPDEAKPYLDQAVVEISNNKPLPGFRPGKATYEDVKRTYGEMLIWETALERIVRAFYVKAVIDEELDTIGSPAISVEKLTPGNDIEFTVTANLMPSATRIADYSKPLVEAKPRAVNDAEVEAALDDLRKMRRSEAVVDRAATAEDMLNIDLDILKDNVLVEGGQSKQYRVYLHEPHYVPGFAEQLVGARKGDEKKFTLPFPEDHYNKMLAGKNVDYAVKVNDVYALNVPPADDEFAKSLGLESIAKLRELLKSNLQTEADAKSKEASEVELLEKLTKESAFSEIPELLVNEEVRRMMHELEHGIEEQGGNMKDYLASIKKTADELKMDFVPQAILRIQTAVLIKEVGKKENIKVTEDEIDAEVDKILATLKPGDKDTRERVISPEFREDVAVRLKNHKVLELLKEKGIKRA